MVKDCPLCCELEPLTENLACPFCEYKATKRRISNYLRHLLVHSYDPKFSRNYMLKHIKITHMANEEANYHCPFCKEKYTFKDLLRIHITRKHSDKAVFIREKVIRNSTKIIERKTVSKNSKQNKAKSPIEPKTILPKAGNNQIEIENSGEVIVCENDNFQKIKKQHPYLQNSDFFENFIEE
jgi:ribosomal protein L37AE/L43A